MTQYGRDESGGNLSSMFSECWAVQLIRKRATNMEDHRERQDSDGHDQRRRPPRNFPNAGLVGQSYTAGLGGFQISFSRVQKKSINQWIFLL